MDLLQNLYMGFSISLTPINILYCLAGCFFGQIVGVLPGIGAPTAVALLLPLTFSITPTSAIILMCFAPALAKFALRFGPAEFFGLAFMSFGLLTVFGAEEPIKTIISTLLV